ncbi:MULTISPECIES: glycerol-3-phosphate dehydrogenase [Vibrio]|uniref:Glycerol-3-phosphate dehydrogenase n=1 Tax=Vibrio halioticoli NBRC 102217 TaxID=1219072 RepID=V5HLM0_9VIBR|nr:MULTISPECIES: glycerol-3-phosphate dehydrogenase [Vibrio]MPW36224.1 glycerol-3-phosphate dehydrogenase [Vibrio sp. B1Z05]GAD90095.1 aerobic glycerol-3-phosphate dehydrogenase [Vibrio halioticoli NBRC 102217]
MDSIKTVVDKHTHQASPILDLIVVGGGINGVGIATDAVSRGLSTALFEAKDFASATSSASSKLIHGGLRYLEHYEFRLVSEALAEREVILKKAPHIAKPMRFRLPHRPYLRPAWMIRAGMYLYDYLGKRNSLPASRKISFANEDVLHNDFSVGFEYSDCWVDDARLVLLNAMQAQQNGAEINNYCTAVSASQQDGIWTVQLLDHRTGQTFTRHSRALVNATGPWVKSFITESLHSESPMGIRLIKGSHIIVPKIYPQDHAYILQNQDGRIVFTIPYLDKYTLIGTTDEEYKGNPRHVAINNGEIDYLLNVVREHFINAPNKQDILATFSGVRPLCDDESDSPQAITRDYTLTVQHASLDNSQSNAPFSAPLLSVFGGKLTTYRKLANAAFEKLAPFFPEMTNSTTKASLLPGAEDFDHQTLLTQLQQKWPNAQQSMLKRWISSYGSRALMIGAQTPELGQRFAKQLFAAEVDYLIVHEFALNSDDILYRRTKLYLEMSADEIKALERYLQNEHYN